MRALTATKINAIVTITPEVLGAYELQFAFRRADQSRVQGRNDRGQNMHCSAERPLQLFE
jgi:hypothetical protein